MKFNPVDKTDSIVADIDFLLFGDGDTFNADYSLVDRARAVNLVYDEATAEMFKADPSHKWDDTTNTDLPFATVDLTSGTDHYTMLDSFLVVHRVRMKDEQGTLQTLEARLKSELTDDELNSSGTPRKYYKIGGVIFPIPIPNYGATDGVEVEFQRGGNYFASDDTDAEPGYNRQFHQFLTVGAALRYAAANGMSEKTNDLSALKEQIRDKMIEHYQLRSPDDKPGFRLAKRNVRRYGLQHGGGFDRQQP